MCIRYKVLWAIVTVTSAWGRKQIFLFLRDVKMRSQTNILVALWPQVEVTRKYFVAPWPQHEVTNKYFCFSVTLTWGHKQIFLILRDLNMRSRTNILPPTGSQDEVARKYFCCSMYRNSNISKFLLLLKNRFQNKNSKIEVLIEQFGYVPKLLKRSSILEL